MEQGRHGETYMVFVFRCKQLDLGYLGALLYDEGQKLLAAEVSGRLFMGMAQNPQAQEFGP
jgi:hypothetical protein